MITCLNCNTPNSPESRFCISCGQTLAGQVAGSGETAVSATSFMRRQLGIATARLLITLLLIWLLRSILINLSFVEGLRIPDFPFTIEQLITFIAYAVAFVLLIGYTQTLRTYWTPAFPSLASLTPALVGIIYVVLLSLAYRALLPLITNLVDDPRDFILALRVVLVILAIILLSWAGKVIYDALPGWLGSIRMDTPKADDGQRACLHCGRLNPAAMKYCGYCGQALKPETEAVAG